MRLCCIISALCLCEGVSLQVHYHGGPLWGGDELIKALYEDSGALVSFRRPEQLPKIAKLKCKIMLDNGAFSTWKAKKGNEDFDWDKHWTNYYLWVLKWFSRIDHFIIPDVIEGTEDENDRLVWRCPDFMKSKAIPVWHSDESLDRLGRLCDSFDYVAIGCCGESKKIRSPSWVKRMDEVFSFLYVENNYITKIHGLRMLDGRVLSKYPFGSADSTNVAINTPKTKVRLPIVTDKLHRVAIMKAAIEKVKPPTVDSWLQNIKNSS